MNVLKKLFRRKNMNELAMEKINVQLDKVFDKAVESLRAEALLIRDKKCGTVGNAEKEMARLKDIDDAICCISRERGRVSNVIRYPNRYITASYCDRYDSSYS